MGSGNSKSPSPSGERMGKASSVPQAGEAKKDHARTASSPAQREHRHPMNQGTASTPAKKVLKGHPGTPRAFSQADLESRCKLLGQDSHLSLEQLKSALADLDITEEELEGVFREVCPDGSSEVDSNKIIEALCAKPSVQSVKGAASLLLSSGMLDVLARHILRNVVNRSDSKLPLIAMLEDGKEEGFRTALRSAEDDIVSAIMKLGNKVKQKDALALEAKDFNDKFAHDSTLREGIYASKDAFMQGVEGSLGLPGKDFQAGIKLDLCHSEDSKDEFVTSNYGGTRTSPEQEYAFVVQPDIDKDYGGGRLPVPLRVFLLACCAKRANSENERHDAPLDDLGAEERDAVKAVLLRRAKEAGLMPSVLRVAAEQDPRLRRLAGMSESDLAELRKTLHNAMASAKLCRSTGQPSYAAVTKAVEAALTSEEAEAMVLHMRQLLLAAGLVEEEVVALRLYTGPLFMKLNSTLRGRDLGHRGNKYVNVIYAVISGMVKLAASSPVPESRTVYRGQSGMRLPDCFWKENGQGVKGGVEMAFLSTTTDMRVAIDYTKNRALPMVFAIKVGAVDNGAALGWVSQYPNEQEILMPPRSFLEVVDEPTLVPTENGPVMTIPVKINCNLQCPTLEKVLESRKSMLVSTLEHMGKEISRDVDTTMESESFKARAKADIFWDEKDYRANFVQSIKGECGKIMQGLVQRPAVRYNDDAEFRFAMLQVLNLQRRAMGKLYLYQEATELYCATIPPSVVECERMAAARLTMQLDLVRERHAAGDQSAAEEARLLALKLCKQRELIREEVDERVPNTPGETPLMQQAADGNVQAISLLVDARANCNAQTTEGKTAVHMAAEGGNTAAVLELVRHGRANPDLRWRGSYTPLHLAASAGQTKTVQAMLKQCGLTLATAVCHQGRTPMLLAAWNGHLPTVKELVAQAKSDVNACDKFGYTAVLLTAQNGHTDILAYLVGEGAQAAVTQQTGYNGVMLAAQHGHVDVIAWLVKKADADPNKAADDGKTALTCAAHFKKDNVVRWLIDEGNVDIHKTSPDGRNAALWACVGGLVSIVEMLVAAGADVRATTDTGSTALHLASLHGNLAVVQYLVQNHEFPVDEKNNDGKRALGLAACKGQREVVLWLVNEGRAQVDGQDEEGLTAAMDAAANGHLDVLQWLVTKGKADTAVVASDGRTLLMSAASSGKVDVVRWILKECDPDMAAVDEDGWSALVFALREGNVGVISLLLRESNTDVNALMRGDFTPLMRAAKWGKANVVKWLVDEAGALVDIKNADGRTALFDAAQGQASIVQWLVESAKMDPNVPDLRQMTPLMVAAEGGHTECVQQLLSCGKADVEASDRCGNTAAMLAAASGHSQAFDLLMKDARAVLDAENVEGWTALAIAQFCGHKKLVADALKWALPDESASAEAEKDIAQRADRIRGMSAKVWRGPPLKSPIDHGNRRVTFLEFNTVRSAACCPAGGRAYYELTIVELPDQPQFGFVTSRFEGVLEEAEASVGDDGESWAVDGIRSQLWQAENDSPWEVCWKEGDVVGLACDLQTRQLHVSLNGDFTAPNGVVFTIDESVDLDGGLFAGFGANFGVVDFNFGGRTAFAFSPPTTDFEPLNQI